MKIVRKLLIKNYDDTHNPKVRARYGVVSGIVGIISNAILCVFKLVVGIIGNSITIVADAINNLADAGSSVVTMVGFKLSSRPADKEHPFGHARYEYVTQLLVAVVILMIGALLMKSSIEKIITPEDVGVNVFTYVVLGVAIFMKIGQMLLYLDFAKAIDSGALKASAADSRNDVIATFAVLVSTIVIDVCGDKIPASISVDGIMGIFVSLFIIISALLLVKESMSPILGEKPDAELVKSLRAKITSYDGVIGLHDLVVHSYGSGVYFAIVHVEVDSREDIMKSHDVIDNIEHDVKKDMGITLSIHLDPVDTQNENVATLKEVAVKALASLDERLSLHDFRLVSGDTHTNVLFDVVVPYEVDVTLEQIEEKMQEAFDDGKTQYYFVLEIDRQYS